MKKILVMILAITLILSNVTTMTIHANKSSDKINLHIINYTDTSAIVEVGISDGSNNFKYTMNGSGGSGLFDVDPGFQWKDDGYAVVAFYIGGNLYDSSQYDSTGQGASNFKITLPEPVAQYTIKVVVVGQGTASVNGSSEITVDEGTTLTFLEEAASGWELQGWDVTLPSTATESATYTVTFVEVQEIPDTRPLAGNPDPQDPTTPSTPTTPSKTVQYVLTVSSTEGGTVPGFIGDHTFNSGTHVNLKPVAEEGYEFVGWEGSVSNNIVVMDSDKSVRAIFRLIPTNEDIFDEDIAQGVLVEEVPEVPFEEDLLDMDIPEASPFEEDINDDALPQTGGLPIGVYRVLGTVLAGAGASLKKKNR